MPQAVVFGAGAIGRGFIAQLLSEAGLEIVFVDIDATLIVALNERGSYTLHLVENDRHETVTVGPVRGLPSNNTDAVSAALAEATVGATAVGARALPQIAPLIARGVARRCAAANPAPLNLIVCENLPDAAGLLRELVEQHLDADGRVYLSAHVGLANAVIARMVPEPTAELRAQDPSAIVAEPYRELPIDAAAWVGAPPAIPGVRPVTPFAPYAARKLYLHNMAHALMGYLGYRRGHTLGYQALDDPLLRPIIQGALEEALRGLMAAHDLSESDLRAHLAQLWPRLGNRALADPVRRLARDPLRKLAPSDRLVGAARLAEAAGMVPINLAWGIAGALAYDAEEDAAAHELQQRLRAEGLEGLLASLCAIAPSEPLGVLVRERYAWLREGRWPT